MCLCVPVQMISGLLTSLQYLCNQGMTTFCSSNESAYIEESCAMYSFVSFFLMVSA